MKNLIYRWQSWSPYLRSILRIVAAFMFIQPGMMKLFAFPAGIPPSGGTVPFFSLLGFAGFLEVVGGVLMLLGLFTRPVAFVLAGEMAVAYFIGHFPNGFWTVLNGGMPAVFFAFVWLYISSVGPGPWSLDNVIRSRSADAIELHKDRSF